IDLVWLVLAGQSTRAPASLTTFAHLIVSALRCAPNCSGVVPKVSTPKRDNRSLTSALWMIALISLLSLPTIFLGVPAGTATPNHGATSKPGRPASATVSTSGAAGERFALVIASTRRRPVFT